MDKKRRISKSGKKPGKRPGKTVKARGVEQDWIDCGIHKPGKSAKGLAKVLGITPKNWRSVYKLKEGTRKITPEILDLASKYFEEPRPMLAIDVVPIKIEREIG